MRPLKDFFSRKKLKVSEGTRFMYCFIFVIMNMEILLMDNLPRCNPDMMIFLEIWSGILVAWMGYILLATLPKFREAKSSFCFRFMDHGFGFCFIATFIAALVLFFGSSYNCQKKSPLIHFYMKVFLIVNGGIILAAAGKIAAFFLKRCRPISYEDEVEMNMSRPSMPYFP